MGMRASASALVVSAVLAFGTNAWGQEPAPQPVKSGFGKRDSFVFSLERVLGVQNQDFGGDFDIDSKALHPIFWGHLGLFAVNDGGFSAGALIGFSHLDLDGDSSITIARLGPRLGYAGALTPSLGYWLRAGPSFLLLSSEEDTSWALGVSIEPMAVITPVDHFGILFGIHADVHIVGEEEGDEESEYSSAGMSLGLMGEFW
jgi:hypothetical protein